jgi:hypothetical protein
LILFSTPWAGLPFRESRQYLQKQSAVERGGELLRHGMAKEGEDHEGVVHTDSEGLAMIAIASGGACSSHASAP